MFRKLTGEKELNSRLNLPGGECPFPIVSNQFARFTSKSFKSVINERVHDVLSFLADSDLSVYLLEDLVDVEAEGLDSSLGSSDNWSSSSTYGFCGFSWGHSFILNLKLLI